MFTLPAEFSYNPHYLQPDTLNSVQIVEQVCNPKIDDLAVTPRDATPQLKQK